MIHSMTAFAHQEHTMPWGNFSWEIRSVNQRYLECYFRLPEGFRHLEPGLRDKVRQTVQRGKIEISLKVNTHQTQQTKLDSELVEQLIAYAQSIQAQLSPAQSQLQVIDLLRWPGVLTSAEQDPEAMQAALLTQVDALLEDFVATRAREGQAMSAILHEKLETIGRHTDWVRQQMPEILTWQKNKLQEKLEALTKQLDPSRFEQEMMLLAQKIDVAEEMDRLHAHIQETQRILSKGGACGRRLDFMMQEFNRESNTLASKSINSDITQVAVELKVLIEQMREQIQNIE
jgi:uncharacterized protein (TIGR00255 family)